MRLGSLNRIRLSPPCIRTVCTEKSDSRTILRLSVRTGTLLSIRPHHAKALLGATFKAVQLVRLGISAPHPPNVPKRESKPKTHRLIMSSTDSKAKVLIVVFLDEVSKEVVAKYADDVVANGGTVKERYYESPGGINGFAASIEVLATFKNFRADEIKYIEADKVVTIQSSG